MFSFNVCQGGGGGGGGGGGDDVCELYKYDTAVPISRVKREKYKWLHQRPKQFLREKCCNIHQKQQAGWKTGLRVDTILQNRNPVAAEIPAQRSLCSCPCVLLLGYVSAGLWWYLLPTTQRGHLGAYKSC